ncbi:amino acid transporter [Aaosphaeria arxii CBS 175.79]|uniref:Amino acid transporter n=1 Tax=Aaosphaeria arxii CBS 175.79 TaxID=1450172 RepID=A0A6A5XIG2_9PLEO|nr:amino acid transporter [Aaosphaeria arxii CBS 175.79]KAF2012912.1 amino acid transporter [Aaosphaeria arxii CBS 175.79]
MNTNDIKKLSTRDTTVSDTTALETGVVLPFGYTQSYRRVLRTLGNVCLVISLTSPLPAIMVTAFYQITYGGYFGLTWGWIIPSILYLPQTLAVAELSSSMPVNGAFYWWAAALAPPRLSRGFAFVTGWLAMSSIVTTLASFSYAAASTFVYGITLTGVSWEPSNAQIMLIAMSVLVLWSSLMFLRLESINVVYIIVAISYLVQLLVFTIGLPATHAAQGRAFTSSEIVFGTITNYSDWMPAVSIPMTWFCAAWVNSGWVVPAFVAEETADSETSVPRAIIRSYILTALIGVLLCVMCAYCIPDMDIIAMDQTGFPLMQLLVEHWGARITSIFILAFTPFGLVGGSAMLLTYASQIAAFARDGGLPFEKYLSHVNERTSIPHYAVGFEIIGAAILLLFSLSPSGSEVVYSLAVLAAVITWAIPVALRLGAGDRWRPGQFNLGRWSVLVHAFTIASQIYLIVMEAFPPRAAFDASSFNYNWVLTVAVILISLGYYYFIGCHIYSFDAERVRT